MTKLVKRAYRADVPRWPSDGAAGLSDKARAAYRAIHGRWIDGHSGPSAGQRPGRKMGQAGGRGEPPGGSTVIGGGCGQCAGGWVHADAGQRYDLRDQPAYDGKMPFDPLKDLSPVTRIASAPNWIVVAENSPFKTFDDLVAKAKALATASTSASIRPMAMLTWRSTPGSRKKRPQRLDHPVCRRVARHAGLDGRQPRWRGRRRGRHHRLYQDGKLRPLTILQSQPSPVLGGTLPFAGDAVRDLNVTTSFVLFTTGGTPPATLERIHEGVTQVMNQPAMKSRMDELALELVLSTPAETAEFTKAENARFKEIVANANLAKQ